MQHGLVIQPALAKPTSQRGVVTVILGRIVSLKQLSTHRSPHNEF